MFEILAVITPFSIMGLVLLIVFVVFFVFPKIKNGIWAEKKFEEMSSPGRDVSTSSAIIEKMAETKEKLADKSKEVTQTIKDKTAESEAIKNVLNPKDNK